MQLAEQRSLQLSRPIVSGGLVLLILLLGESAVAARSIELEDWSRGANTLVFLVIAGVLCGAAIGKSTVHDLLCHLWAVVVGAGLSVMATAYFATGIPLSYPGRVRYLSDAASIWVRNWINGKDTQDDLLFIVALGVLVWMVGYAAAWFLFRRGWLLPALVLPGMLIVISVTNGGKGHTKLALGYVLLGLALAAVQVSRLRAAAWHRAGLPFSTIAWRASAIGGSVIGLLAVVLVWAAPINPPQGMMQAVADQLQQPLDAASDAWDDLTQRLSANHGSTSDFADFGDQFSMGGALKLGNDPVAVLESDQPHYLAAQRYSVYTGSGWSSDPVQSIDGDAGEVSAPPLSFPANKSIYLPSSILSSSQSVSGTIDVLKPTGDRLLTIENYVSASERASIDTSWRKVTNERYDLDDQSNMPAELRNLASLLLTNTFTRSPGGKLVANNPDAQSQIDDAVSNLTSRFLTVNWDIDRQGNATAIYATGWMPNYDDVNAISVDQEPVKGDSYSVTGVESTATSDQLEGSGDDYPDYISSQYLDLPSTVTERTRQLASKVAGDDASAYQKAVDIETYLRNTYQYDESISGPSGGQDAVDYFLFDAQRGYCEYFASAMVVMLRSLDVPSRIVAGFREASFDPSSGGYLFTEKQAHTWVEVYFPQYGWVPFEPTPGNTTFDQAEPTQPVPAVTPTDVPVEATAEIAPTPTATATPQATAAATQPTDTDSGHGSPMRAIISALVAAAGMMGVIGFYYWLRRTKLVLPPAERNYRRLVKASRRAGIVSGATTTPQELAMRVGEAMPVIKPDSDTITALYRKELYGRQELTSDDLDLVERAWRSVRSAMSFRRLRRRFKRG